MVRLEHVVFTHELLSALFRVHILITAREAVVVFVALPAFLRRSLRRLVLPEKELQPSD